MFESVLVSDPLSCRYRMRSILFTLLHVHIRASIEECLAINEIFQARNVPTKLLQNHCESIVEGLSRLPPIPKAVIRNDVFPFTVLTEDPFVDNEWRPKFFAKARSIADACATVECIGLEMNRQIYEITDPPIVFEPAPPNKLNSYSVLETLHRKKGSCTAMSVILITALRMVGVPSRIVGVPHWNLGLRRCPEGDASEECGNHNWVEIFLPNRGWSFIDQRRPDLEVLPLNHSWFYPDFIRGNSRIGHGNHSVYAASFFPVDDLEKSDYFMGNGVVKADHFPMVWDWENHAVHSWDVSATYHTDEESIYTVEET